MKKKVKLITSMAMFASIFAVAVLPRCIPLADVQVLTTGEMRNFIGSLYGCCKGDYGTGYDCQACHQHKTYSIRFSMGGVGRGCIKGDPDECDWNGILDCGNGVNEYYNSSNCTNWDHDGPMYHRTEADGTGSPCV